VTVLSLLVGHSNGDSDSGDTTTIIAVSVLIPIACSVALTVVIGATILTLIHYVQANLRKGSVVNFTAGDSLHERCRQKR